MQTKNTAFVIPIYPPDYRFRDNILKTFKENELDLQADIWFVFTNEEDAMEFGEYDNKIILDKSLREFKNRGYINIKKFYALKKLKDKYKYLISLDSELEFIKNVDLNKICDNYFENKTLYANRVFAFQTLRKNQIEQCCMKYFKNHKNFSTLNKLVKVGYMWFNNLPVYKTSTLDEFFNVIDYEKNITQFCWEDFDYYIYMFYLILYHNFKVEDLKMFGMCAAGENIPEGFSFRPESIKKDVKFKMCTKSAINMFDNDELFIAVHLDRNLQFLFTLLSLGIDRVLNRVNSLEEELIQLSKKRKNSPLNKLKNFLFKKEKEVNRRRITICNFIKISYKKVTGGGGI